MDGELTKQKIRDLHAAQRLDVLEQRRAFVEIHGSELAEHFASGNQVDPALIDPELVEVTPESLDSRLFRFACLLWSVPVSQGFGRRLRFLVRDRQNGRLVGIFALGDPVFNLSARDNWIGWTHEDRRDRLVHVMDAYVVGAVPPYSQLIGGKLVAALMASTEVKRVYERKYLGRQAVISEKKHRARLVLLTNDISPRPFINLQSPFPAKRPSLSQDREDERFRPFSLVWRDIRVIARLLGGNRTSVCVGAPVWHGT